MSRPVEYENLRTVTLSANMDLIEQAKSRGLNLSKVFRRALADALLAPVPKKKKQLTLEERMMKQIPPALVRHVKNKVSLDPRWATAAEKIVNQRCGTHYSKRDFLTLAYGDYRILSPSPPGAPSPTPEGSLEPNGGKI